MRKFMDILTKIEMVVCSAAMAVMVVLTAGNVVARKFFNSSWSFTEELTCALFILITMLGAAMTSRKNGHISLNIISDRLPVKAQKALILLATLVAVAFGGVLIAYGAQMVIAEIKSGQTTAALHIKEWIYGMTIPVGGLMITLHSLEYGITAILNKEDGK